MDSALTLEGVTRSFGGVRALADVSLQVAARERRAVIGPNGAGKTTLFRLISGELPVSDGRIRLFGQDITHLPSHARARRRLGRTYQITNVFPALCVEDNVLLAALGTSRPWMKLQPLRTVPRRGPLRDRVERALLDVGLQDRAAAVVRELSHGEQRQLELALALAGEPRVLMLDEPAAGLSAAERVRMSELIRGLSPELTLVIIEHDMDLVLNLVDRVTCLHNGRVVAEATPASIRQDATIQSIYLGVGQAC